MPQMKKVVEMRPTASPTKRARPKGVDVVELFLQHGCLAVLYNPEASWGGAIFFQFPPWKLQILMHAPEGSLGVGRVVGAGRPLWSMRS